MGAGRGRLVLRLDAAFHAVVGVVLVLSTWDGLYDAVALPKPNPALLAQLGGIALVTFAYLLWLAGDVAALRRPVALASASANAGSAVTIGLWLVLRGEEDLLIDSGGMVLLGVVAVVLAGFAIAQALVARAAR